MFPAGMQALHRFHRLIAWIALAAMLLAALVPASSKAFAASGEGGAWAEVCTAMGMVMLPAAPASDEDSGAPGALDRPACPYCCPHAGSVALLAVSASFFAAPAFAQPAPTFLPALAASALRWRIDAARAPPPQA